ncbi:hypothetical protein ASPWEDRAFT_28148 [Aspergillus wentii DTO 134E9]|uniref:Uncharacterized protein n=1 Tax=Aspergillus wentii DTO 134E9 TaxID=1073089 RepID=A0A1L9RKR8_ASPWE|nr:uncharacterized protein ASPWEDRAFT_28148 [Aspergillus wentii DTO 134E9]KAI9924715.1 hypothetical protein MW887_006570 [Aspergillus wentii]OJJ35520.1 hypothetical protein ASPWEDRAFT_28148 [Aspergillus wentii DTO 134E9]
MTTQPQLEVAAREVIHRLQDIEEFQNVRILIIGGLAVKKYRPMVQETREVDFLVDLGPRLEELPSGASELLTQGLTVVYPNDLSQPAEMRFKFRFKSHLSPPNDIPIKFVSGQIAPYVPQTAMTIAATKKTNTLPYISQLDLAIIKIFSCGMRATHAQRRQDAVDAGELVRDLNKIMPIQPSAQQDAAIQG